MVCGLPVPGEEFRELFCRVIGNTVEHVGEIGLGLGIEAVELCRFDQRVHRCRALAATVRPGKEPVLAADGHCPFILPRSGRNLKSITAGILILAARSVSGRSRSALTAAIFG